MPRGSQATLVRTALSVAAVVLLGMTVFFAAQRWPDQMADADQPAPAAADPSAASTPADYAAMFDDAPTLLVLGDSYAGGTGDPTFSPYPPLVANQMGWNLAVDAQGGTGFVKGVTDIEPVRVPFGERLDRDAASFHADYILIDGGRNDLDLAPDQVIPAMEAYVKRVRALFPDAKIGIVLPSYASDRPAENFPALAEAMRRVAGEVDASVIDPVEQRWYLDRPLEPLLWHDGIHLSGEGNRYYAQRIVENLRQMGFGS